MRYVLASGSPRRRELITKVVNNCEIITSKIDERTIEDEILTKYKDLPKDKLAVEITETLSKEKALAVFKMLGEPNDTIVIGADTTVSVYDEIMGKPVDKADAIRMLRKESTYPQHVITGITLVEKNKIVSFFESTEVIFKELDDEQEKRIEAYVNTEEPYDKAGAYGIQDSADDMILKYNGDYNNIIGLPVERLKNELEDF